MQSHLHKLARREERTLLGRAPRAHRPLLPAVCPVQPPPTQKGAAALEHGAAVRCLGASKATEEDVAQRESHWKHPLVVIVAATISLGNCGIHIDSVLAMKASNTTVMRIGCTATVTHIALLFIDFEQPREQTQRVKLGLALRGGERARDGGEQRRHADEHARNVDVLCGQCRVTGERGGSVRVRADQRELNEAQQEQLGRCADARE